MMRWRRPLILLLILIVMSACGQVPEAEPVVIVSETTTTRTVPHTFGTNKIPKAPQRVVALGEDPLLADLLEIGIQVEGEMESVAEVNENPLWAQLPAVQRGNVVTLDRLGYPGFRGQKALLQDLIEALE